MNKKTENRVSRLVSILLAAALLTASLTGCGGISGVGNGDGRPLTHVQTTTPAEKPAVSPAPVQDTAPAKTPAPVQNTVPVEAPVSTEPDSTEAGPSVSSTSVETKGPDMASPEGVARLGEMEGDQSFIYVPITAIVNGINIDKDHNPYDLTWRYGVRKEYNSRDEEWGALYQSYVDACDWSLVFDADWYMAEFPMLATLYHHNKDLLLEHYQTVGVHEGRQASAGFCPAVYAENCDPALKKLFGKNWECYTFYYMLNHDSERSVNTASSGYYRTWLCVELSKTQALELEHVNEYRAEAGAVPVEVHPEMMALANFRAWTDAWEGNKAHDWLEANKEEMYVYMDWMGMSRCNENTVKSWGANKPCLDGCWVNFYESPSHYEAMVRADQRTFGTSNCYWSAHTQKVCCSFDVYTNAAVPVRTLK